MKESVGGGQLDYGSQRCVRKKIIPLMLVGYEMIRANLVQCAMCFTSIYHLFNTCSRMDRLTISIDTGEKNWSAGIIVKYID